MPNPGQCLLAADIRDVMDAAPAYVADGAG